MAQTQAKKVMGHSAPDNEWLAKVHEDALDPGREIVDPHHHLWMRPGQPYLMPEFVDDLSTGHNIVSTVFAECHSMYRQSGPEALKSLGETEFVAGCAAMAESGVFGSARICEGIVGRVELTLGEATRDVFEQHIERSGGRFRGVRYSTAWDASERINNVSPEPERLAEPAVRQAAAIMSEMGLSLDCWVYHPQLDEVADLAGALPELTIVLNHAGVPILGGPYRDRREEVFRDWREGIARVGKHENVYIKLGALPIIRAPSEGGGEKLPPTSEEVADAWRPWLETCIEAFGPRRSMFESNFPVQKLWAGYAVTWNAFKRIASGASDEEKNQLFAGAARAAYRLS